MSALDKKKTFTNLAFVNLLESDISVHAAKKQTMFSTNTMQDFNKTYWTWKHNYRTRYTVDFLKRHGFDSETESTIDAINKQETIDYVSGSVENFYSFRSASLFIPSEELQFSYYMQEHYPTWSNSDLTFIYGGETYIIVNLTFKENDDPEIEDDTSILIGTFECVSDVSQENIEIEAPNEYADTRCLIATYYPDATQEEWLIFIENADTIPAELIEVKTIEMTPIVQIKHRGRLVNVEGSLKKMMNKLKVEGDAFEESLTKKDDDGEPEIDEAYLINGLSLQNPYEVEAKSYSSKEAQNLPTALLMKIKQEGGRHDQSTSSKKKYSYTLTQDVADKWYDDHLREQAYLARALFRTFGYMTGSYDDSCTEHKSNQFFLGPCMPDIDTRIGDKQSGFSGSPFARHFSKSVSGGISFNSGSNFLAQYAFNVETETVQGQVRPDIKDRRSQCSFHFSGKIVTAKDDEGKRHSHSTEDSLGYDLLEIKVQIDHDHYQIMRITNFGARYKISGHSFSMSMGYPENELRVLIPYFVEQKLKFSEYVVVHEHSFVLMAYAIKTVVIKWYKRFMGVIIAVLLCATGFMCGLGFAITVGTAIVTTLIMEFVMENVSSDLLKSLFGVILMVIQMFLGNFDFSAMTIENYLPLATEIAGAAYKYYQIQLAKIDAENAIVEAAEENIDTKIDNYNEATTLNVKAIMAAHYSFSETHDPDVFYAGSLGDNLYDFDQFFDVDGNLELRKQVRSG
ncbi:MAG: hypothetical protein KAH01_07230 [Caldisericia bacterium]|nr:hypothetical protein [Caldisericia bacterium]